MTQDRPETFAPWDAADYIQTVEDVGLPPGRRRQRKTDRFCLPCWA